MRRYLSYLTIVLLLITSQFCLIASADTTPTLVDTDTWLQSHLPPAALSSIGGDSASAIGWNVSAAYKISGCTLSISMNSNVVHITGDDSSIYHLDFKPATGKEFRWQDGDTALQTSVKANASLNFSDFSPSEVSLTKAMKYNDDALPPIDVATRLFRLSFDDL